MTKQVKSYKIKTTGRAIMPSQLPNIRIDYKGLIKYAHSKGVKAGELTDSEKNQFVSAL